MRKNILYAQSGGPTAVINASAGGVISEAQKLGIGRVFAGINGIEGILNENLRDVTQLSQEDVRLLQHTPGAAFGSCRYKLAEFDKAPDVYRKISEIFQKYDIGCFFYNGGNDSMDTCCKIARYFAETNTPCQVIGIPKTIDNDLAETDHCPGFGSAAKYIATAIHEIALDTASYPKGKVTVVEIMGRDAGWLTASSIVANHCGAGPDLIYLPEKPFDIDAFAEDVKKVYGKKHRCLVAVAEGIKDEQGNYLTVYQGKDTFNHVQMGGTAYRVAKLLEERGFKTRAVELNLPQRCAAHLMSRTDRNEAIMSGKEAVRQFTKGATNCMIAIKRTYANGKYRAKYFAVPLENVANAVKHVPSRYILPHGQISSDLLPYILPLMEGTVPQRYSNGIPHYFKSDITD